MTVIEVQNLQKSFSNGWLKKISVLKNVSFQVPRGSITGFVGANGSGKTTTFKSLLQFIFPDQGKVSFFAQQELSPDVRKKLGYWPERPYLPEQLTAMEFLKLHWQLGGGDLIHFKTRAEEVLRDVELWAAKDKPLRQFSKGMQQRVGLAQALLCRPELLILDEPMSGLDPDGRFLVKEILKREHARGVSIFFSSHLLADMDELCSHLVVIDQGEILFNGPVADFTHTGVEISRNIEQAFATRIRRNRLPGGPT